ncbi:MAG: hypothetical protein QF664_10470 [Dehalococcoidia bacterium]|nr:hypothetical protein [Dehalococcoidia bacterium]
MSFIRSARNEEPGLTDRTLVARVLHRHLIAPQLKLDVVEAWPDRLLSRVATLFAAEKRTLNTSLVGSDDVFGQFCDAIDARLSDEAEKVRAAMRPISGQVAQMMRELVKMPEFKLRPIELPKFTIPPIQADILRSLTQTQQFVRSIERLPAVGAPPEPSSGREGARDRPASDDEVEPFAWGRVERQMGRLQERLREATAEEDYQSVGYLCREALISLAQAVYDRAKHPPLDGIEPSVTDMKRMLDAYFSVMLAGKSHREARQSAKASLDLANSLQHDRSATAVEAAMCAQMTIAVVNCVAIIEKVHQRF